jgi:hypothetical protein
MTSEALRSSQFSENTVANSSGRANAEPIPLNPLPVILARGVQLLGAERKAKVAYRRPRTHQRSARRLSRRRNQEQQSRTVSSWTHNAG